MKGIWKRASKQRRVDDYFCSEEAFVFPQANVSTKKESVFGSPFARDSAASPAISYEVGILP
jgi:hypothetical protein